MKQQLKPYSAPTKGKQSIQEYHPLRGVNYQAQVSTYNGDSWNIKFCSWANAKETQQSELKRASL